MRCPRVLLLVPVAAVALACADLGSAGSRPVPAWSATVELRLGSVDDPETALTFVGSVLAGPDGRFYVTQPQDNTVRMYNEAGELLGRFGRQGDGPGEFRGMSAIGWWAGGKDTLWISDFQTRRVNLFLADGTFARTITMSAAPYREVMSTSVQSILPDGTALGTPSYPSRLLAEGQIRSIPMLRFPLSEGEPRALLELEPGNRQLAIQVGTGQMYSAQPFADADFTAVSGEAGRIAVIERPVASGEGDARYRVTMVDAEGDTLWSREYPYQPSAIPAAELDSVVAARTLRATEFATRAGGDRADAEKQVREKLRLPAFRPPLAGARISEDGAIWLQWTPVPGAATNRWLLLDADGDPSASLELPSNLRLLEVQGTTAWGVETGELGVPYVVRLALGPADPS